MKHDKYELVANLIIIHTHQKDVVDEKYAEKCGRTKNIERAGQKINYSTQSQVEPIFRKL